MALRSVAASLLTSGAERTLRKAPTHAKRGDEPGAAAPPPMVQAMFDAVANGSLEELRESLAAAAGGEADAAAEAAVLETPHPTHGGTCLHVAASVFDDEAAAELISELCARGAAPNARARNSSTALHWAAGAGNAAAVRALLRGGADPTLTTWTWGQNVFGKGSGQTPAHWAAESGHQACLEALLDGSALAPFAEDERGSTPLDLAEKECQGNAIRLLKEAANTEMVCLAVSTEAVVHHVLGSAGADAEDLPPRLLGVGK